MAQPDHAQSRGTRIAAAGGQAVIGVGTSNPCCEAGQVVSGDDAQLHDETIERLDFPADGHAFGGPSTCITHVGEVSFAAKDDDGRLSRLSNWFFNRLRRMCL